MHTKRVTRYYSECGKGFWKKEDAEIHEQYCRCLPKIQESPEVQEELDYGDQGAKDGRIH
jgi:hypothetical protein